MGLRVKGEPAGIMATIVSNRVIEGAAHRLCHLGSWFVEEQHRGLSFRFLIKVLTTFEDHTIVVSSSTPRASRILQSRRFLPLDSGIRLLLPRWSGRTDPAFETLIDEDQIHRLLTAGDRKLIEDHRAYGCRHLLVRSQNEYCHVIYSRVEGPRFKVCYLHHLSNLEVFLANHQAVRKALASQEKVRLLVVDSRLLGGKTVPSSVELPLDYGKIYRSPDGLKPGQIDNLYSEVILLDLPPVAHFGQVLRAFR